ncbi:VOC family protein [Cupriavidus basilensis]|uniref:VOC family protein n=1 Tax=Cupriavidus basilensis TaxID=68895 RepID=UPI0023E890AA|nr:VOC family protein [Cupriavidus basilensis]MDF3887047.1 VOC family protein [Cupriavidus basilensis]
MSIVIDRFDHIVLNVKDVETSAAWYESVLGMQREDFESRTGKRVSVRFGQQKINLRPIGTDTEAWFTGTHPTAGSDDLCFITRNTLESVIAHWLAHRVPIEAGPAQRTGALGPMTSVYCRDPDGNLIEVAAYPAP